MEAKQYLKLLKASVPSSQWKLSCTHAKMHVYTCISACIQCMHVYTCKSHACVHMLFSMWGYPASTHALCTCKIACVILHVYTCNYVVYTWPKLLCTHARIARDTCWHACVHMQIIVCTHAVRHVYTRCYGMCTHVTLRVYTCLQACVHMILQHVYTWQTACVHAINYMCTHDKLHVYTWYMSCVHMINSMCTHV